MRSLRHIAYALLMLCGYATAQTPSTVTLQVPHVYDGSGANLVPDGSTFCVLTTDEKDRPKGYRVGTAGQSTTAAGCHTVTGGSAGSFTIINSGASYPLNACVRFTVNDPNGRELRRDVCAQPGTAASIGTWCSGTTAITCTYDSFPSSGTTVSLQTQGPAATVQVGTVTTGAAGSSAAVTNTGTSKDAILNFTIPGGGLTTAQQSSINDARRNKTVNVFDKSVGFTTLSYINYTTGAQVTLGDGTYQSSPYMAISAGGYVVSNLRAGTDGTNGVAFYDAAKTYISGVAGSSFAAGTSIVAPSTAAFMRYGARTADIAAVSLSGQTGANAIVVALSSTLPASYVGFGTTPQYYVDAADTNLQTQVTAKPDLPDALSQSMQLVGGAAANLLVQATVTKDAGVLRSTGGLTTGLTNVYATDYFPLKPGKTYTIKVAQVAGNTSYGIAYYDKNKTYVSAGPSLPWTTGTTFTVPSTGTAIAYGRSTGYYAGVTAELTAQMITEGSTAPTAYAASIVDTAAASAAAAASIATKMSSPWNGKTYGIWGDSICATYGGNWTPLVESFHPMTRPFTDCRHGRAISEWAENYSLSGGVYTRVTSTTSPASVIVGGTVGNTLAQDLTGLNLLLIELGTNTPIESFGTVSDAAGSGTTAGYIKQMLDAITKAAPTVRIAWVLPYRANPTASRMASETQYQQLKALIIAVCQLYGVAIIDEGSLSGIGPQTWTTYLGDGVHVNTAGGIRFATVLNRQLVSVGGN